MPIISVQLNNWATPQFYTEASGIFFSPFTYLFALFVRIWNEKDNSQSLAKPCSYCPTCTCQLRTKAVHREALHWDTTEEVRFAATLPLRMEQRIWSPRTDTRKALTTQVKPARIRTAVTQAKNWHGNTRAYCCIGNEQNDNTNKQRK